MELDKQFNHQEAEKKWYAEWIEKQYFSSTPNNQSPYTIVIPPPNITGVLHMGHCLNNTIQDILIRFERMRGKNTCWVPGTDHASIATEVKVVALLKEKGIDKKNLSRTEFLTHAFEWKEKYGNIILEQFKRLGCSLDWNRTTFTMDATYSQSVTKIFVSLYKQGLIYRGQRMIHWDCKAQTALSDEEVIYKEVSSQLCSIRYALANANGQPLAIDENNPTTFITVATVRPETIFGDVAICVNPKDIRYQHLIGQHAFVPLQNRKIPIIADDYVDISFGTGCLKITPAHDINDFHIAQRNQLPTIQTLHEDGTLSKEAGFFIGEDRFIVRKKIIPLLQQQHHIADIKPYTHQIGYSERTSVVVEPRLSWQWWVRMTDISKPALEAVMNDDIEFYPTKYKNVYRHWMENIKDWCISRQLWWGHRIPAWYDSKGNVFVGEHIDDIYNEYPHTKQEVLKQDEDCLDTWFSSWLWPIEVFKGISHPQNADIQYYYPTQTLVTAPEIIFFWVARMIIAGYHFQGKKPFSRVYFTGIVRDKKGQKMSKSLGNSPDLLALIDTHGADAVRFGIMIASPAGNDLLFDETSIEQGKHFIHKLWNALRLIKGWEQKIDATIEFTQKDVIAIKRFRHSFYVNKKDIIEDIEHFKLSEALKKIYTLAWDDFCSDYLEDVKPLIHQPIHPNVYEATIFFFGSILQLLHPFMPFATEDIYQKIKKQESHLCVKQFEKREDIEVKNTDIEAIKHIKKITESYREWLQKNNYKPKEEKKVYWNTTDNSIKKYIQEYAPLLQHRMLSSSFEHVSTAPPNLSPIISGSGTFYIEMLQPQTPINATQEIDSLEKELAYQKGFLASVQKKLSNEKFMSQAQPKVIAMEQKKEADSIQRIKEIENSLRK